MHDPSGARIRNFQVFADSENEIMTTIPLQKQWEIETNQIPSLLAGSLENKLVAKADSFGSIWITIPNTWDPAHVPASRRMHG